jgi:hypothetical protein
VPRGAPRAEDGDRDAPVAWGKPERELVLGLAVRGEVVEAVLQNRGTTEQQVIAKGVGLKLVGSGWSGDVYDHQGPIYLNRPETFATLAPGRGLRIPIDVGERARRVVGSSGARAIPPGRYEVTARYDAATELVGDWWGGVLEAGPIVVEIH